MTELDTRLEMDSSPVVQAAREASTALENVATATREAQSEMSGLGRDGLAALAPLRQRLDDLGDGIDSLRSETEQLNQAIKETGEQGELSATQLRRMVSVAGGLLGMGSMVAIPMLRAAGMDKGADYLGGVGGGAISGAALGANFGPVGIGIGAVGGGALGAAKTALERGSKERQEAEALDAALKGVSLSSAAAMRSLQELADVSQAEGALKALREEATRLDQAMALGLESGPVAEKQRDRLGRQIGVAEARLGELQAGAREDTIGQARQALADYGSQRGKRAEAAQFGASLEAAGSAAEKMELVNARLADFTRRGDELRRALEDLDNQADATRFGELLASLREVDAESDRLRSLKFDDQQIRRMEPGSPILTDALTRIGGGSGNATPLNAVERNTGQMARLLQSADRHLAALVAKEEGGAAWA